MRIIVIALSAGLLVPALTASPAEAKGPPTYTLTGGDLGEHAMSFGAPDDGYLLDGTNAEQIDAPRVPPGIAYDIYVSAAYTYGSRLPALLYYPESGLIDSRQAPKGWYRLDPSTSAFLKETVEDARWRMAGGTLARNPIEAEFLAAGMDAQSYSVRREPIAGGAPLWGAAVESACPCPMPAELVPDLIMTELVDILSQAPSGTEAPRDVILISQDVSNGYGALGCYAPPADGRPGRFWLGCPPLWQSGTPDYHETTARFDAIIRETIELRLTDAQALPPSAEPRTAATSTAGATGSLIGIAAAVAGAALLGVVARRRLRLAH